MNKSTNQPTINQSLNQSINQQPQTQKGRTKQLSNRPTQQLHR